ncbi:hypothetical protein [Halospina sp. K52047b]|uniref:hypothetical protein n=1 Tax=Halospina sp. K52047b TaxID=2614160 RepID=UPI00124A0076|nr:hypothetical protein [Halospina sp. K52047b]KAA8982613.1 hypothetical protein F3089_08850 [Halospina sp. K52047b]
MADRNLKTSMSLMMLWLAGVPSAWASGMEPMSNREMADVRGQGVGIVMEDFRFAHGHDPDNNQTFRLSGITNQAGEDVEVLVDQLYIGGAGSQRGESLQTVNLGRLTNPFGIDLVDGDGIGGDAAGKAVFEYAAPEKVAQAEGVACLPGGADTGCVSRAPNADQNIRGERMDLGFETTVHSGTAVAKSVNIHAEKAVVDGSYIQLWGATSDDSRQQLRGRIQTNFYTPSLTVSACEQGGTSCNTEIAFNDFMMELALGNEHQPLFMGVLGVGQEVMTDGEVVAGPGNFRLELKAINDARSPDPINEAGDSSSDDNATYDFYSDYYTNDEYRSDIEVGSLEVGGQDMGSTRMKGMLFQKLDVTTRSLD